MKLKLKATGWSGVSPNFSFVTFTNTDGRVTLSVPGDIWKELESPKELSVKI